MAVVPAICKTCGTVWFTSGMFAIGPGASAHFEESEVSPCPSCGGMGAIPDGIYEATRMTLANPQQYAIISAALAEIQRLLETKSQPAEIARTIEEKYPFLASLKRYLPKDASQMAAVVAVLLSIINSCQRNAAADRPPIDIQAQKAIVDALHDIASRLPPVRPDIPVPPPQ